MNQFVVTVFNRTPTASILKSIEPVDITAPTVVSFSSRGPNLITLDILKVHFANPIYTCHGININVLHLMLTF